MLPQNLKSHIKGAHKATIVATRRGATSIQELIAIRGKLDLFIIYA